MHASNIVKLRDILQNEGTANVLNIIAIHCDEQVRRHQGGAADSTMARQRKAWSKVALGLATFVSILRQEC
jgi:hypothetical protein